jgi:hypothetical protein
LKAEGKNYRLAVGPSPTAMGKGWAGAIHAGPNTHVTVQDSKISGWDQAITADEGAQINIYRTLIYGPNGPKKQEDKK